jgi:lipopolysaccharide/colanic/teichoic acid biosynthesis glycosyltransferase
LLTFSAAPYDELRLVAKRLTDIAIAAAGLAALSPLMLLIAVAIRLGSPGPAIFRQVRCGLNGRRFLFYKFRSMCANAEDLKPLVAHLSTKETAFKIPDDPRLTPIGRWLRKFSIDEWPSCGMFCAATCLWSARARPSPAKSISTSAGRGAGCACVPG